MLSTSVQCSAASCHVALGDKASMCLGFLWYAVFCHADIACLSSGLVELPYLTLIYHSVLPFGQHFKLCFLKHFANKGVSEFLQRRWRSRSQKIYPSSPSRLVAEAKRLLSTPDPQHSTCSVGQTDYECTLHLICR